MESRKIGIIFAHLIDPYISQVGGGVRYISDVANYMSKQGANVTLVGTTLQKPVIARLSLKIKFIPVNRFVSRAWQLYLIGLLSKIPFLRLPKRGDHSYH